MPSTDPASRIGLGTAQFGSDYGITNRLGQVSEGEAASILSLAIESGIDTIDTARLYGKSEEVIGRTLGHGTKIRVVTKTAKLASAASAEDAVAQLNAGFTASLEALRCPAAYALLVHDPRDLIGPCGPAIWRALEELKRSGLVQKIGVSVYEGDEIDRILDRYAIEIVQLPFNVLDRRLVRGGQLSRLASAGVEVHARSLFLQGLLLAPADAIPSQFEPVRGSARALDQLFSVHGLSRLAGLVALAFQETAISRFIVGVTSPDELAAIILAAKEASRVEGLQVPEDTGIDALFLNPARWGELGNAEGNRNSE
jgi:aryl-alcohol dehydrogenase-like predicted oxidoreductase